MPPSLQKEDGSEDTANKRKDQDVHDPQYDENEAKVMEEIKKYIMLSHIVSIKEILFVFSIYSKR